MKKGLKSAFSLAELLIALGIISIITVMLMSISKQGMEEAMNLYYYTGYKGMQDAISYSIEKAGEFDNRRIAEALGFSAAGIAANGEYEFPTKNGITYTRRAGSDPIIIDMRIPSTNGETNVKMFYTGTDGGGMLVPGDATRVEDNTIVAQLYNRKDLLPFYVDDGERGRVIQGIQDHSTTTNGAFNYQSFVNAYCSMSMNHLSNNNIINTINTLSAGNPVGCGLGGTAGVLKVANPKKVF